MYKHDTEDHEDVKLVTTWSTSRNQEVSNQPIPKQQVLHNEVPADYGRREERMTQRELGRKCIQHRMSTKTSTCYRTLHYLDGYRGFKLFHSTKVVFVIDTRLTGSSLENSHYADFKSLLGGRTFHVMTMI